MMKDVREGEEGGRRRGKREGREGGRGHHYKVKREGEPPYLW